ncbi:MAG TPA: bifunctional 4-hydroxy-2-oxoglutarate aldolase/2-dehydro-3-deoxy-phosphogluconate aldolase [Ruminiclostridium sp.]
MNNVLDRIKSYRLVPVIKLDRACDAVPFCNVLKEGGLPVAEITFRTDAAEESIKLVNKNLPEILLGAGTILNVEQAKRAISAGVSYIVTPGFSPKVVEYCLDNNMPIVPGICTPTEMQYAYEYGLEVVKFFPAEQAGGLPMIKALSGPFPNMRFLPTGGINEKNVVDYLKYEKIIACGGSWMANDSLIKNGEFEKLLELVKEAVRIVHLV